MQKEKRKTRESGASRAATYFTVPVCCVKWRACTAIALHVGLHFRGATTARGRRQELGAGLNLMRSNHFAPHNMPARAEPLLSLSCA